MTAEEYKAALEKLGLTLIGAARLFGVDYSTSRRWADGRREVPPPVARFLRFLMAANVEPWEVHKALGEEWKS